MNDNCPRIFVAGIIEPNHNMWSHDEAVKLVNTERFNESWAEEMDSIFKNEKTTILKRSNVLPEKSILRSVLSHKQKTKPIGVATYLSYV